ncbi:MAG: 4Fe-4S dicluster domain-containing protein [Thermodesulfobacteriota bacterium]|nr:4Fe-4S dicluster domain-containing protein [Thermodesulfobacteriota bacterium]
MAHNLHKDSFSRLVDRLNKFPQGAPPSELLFKILKMLFSEKEAGLVASLPIKPFPVEKAAQAWKMKISKAQHILDKLAGRAILVDMYLNNRMYYVLPPPMAGFFEFSMMRLRNDVNQKMISQMFYQYLNVEEDFVRELFTQGETQLGRTFVHEPALSCENALHVLDYERATHVIETTACMGVSLCYCRHKMQHLGRACDAPLEICMTFNTAADALIRHEFARQVDRFEGLDLLQKAYDHNLVQFGENVRENVNFICNCCGCCCEAMQAAQRFSILNPVHTTAFLPEVDEETCTGCGKCVEICPVKAMTLVTANDPKHPKLKKAKLNASICLGCGVCVRVCPCSSISLVSREKRVITPLNGMHRAVVMAIERGRLQELIFDNQVLWSHRALAGLLGVILRLPPFKQIMASRQVKSRYLELLIRRLDYSRL